MRIITKAQNKMLNRLVNVEEALEKRIYSNGGHWCKITWKKDNCEYIIARAGESSFERLYADSFRIYKEGKYDETVKDFSCLRDLARYLMN